MYFKLTDQAINMLIYTYKVKKSLIRKLEKYINDINVVKHPEDYLQLIQNILMKFNLMNKYSKKTLTLTQLINIEIIRKYGDISNKKNNIKQKIKI